MDYIFKHYKILNNYLKSPTIEIFEFEFDPFSPEEAENIFGYDENFNEIMEGITFSINGIGEYYYIRKLIETRDALYEEINQNFKLSKSIKFQQEYLNKLINEITLFDKKICENDILFEHLDVTYNNKHNLKIDEYIKERISDIFYKLKKHLREMIDYLNIRLNEIDSGNISIKTNISNMLNWERSDTDLLELILALIESGAIQNSTKDLKNKDGIELFSKIFNKEIKDPYKKLNAARNRKKEEVTPFLIKLQGTLEEYYKKQDKKDH